MDEILQFALEDSDQWVAMVADILKTFPSTGSLNCDVDDSHFFFHEVASELKKSGKFCSSINSWNRVKCTVVRFLTLKF